MLSLVSNAFTYIELVIKVRSDVKQHIFRQYPELYNIQLKPDAKPHTVFSLSRIPLPPMSKVKEDISRLLHSDFIARIRPLSDVIKLLWFKGTEDTTLCWS